MTKSTITRERLQEMLEWCEVFRRRPRLDDIAEAIRMALAAMDSKPDCKERKLFCSTDTARMRKVISASAGSEATPLCRHAQPAPVVPDERDKTVDADDHPLLWSFNEGWNACRAAMLQAVPVRSSMPDGVVTAEHRRVIEMLLSVCGAAFELADDSCQQDVDGEECHVVPSDAFQKLSDALDEIENTLPTEDIDRPDVFLAWSAMPRAALKSLLQAGYSPVIPEGYVMVPKEPTERMVIDGFESEPDETFSEPEVWEAFQKMSGCEQAAFRARLCWAAMLAAVPPAPTQENI